eukprot:TRINITY_DN162_c3_g2_i1.p1 TRINITY_DN162_c3_g2~~TRINITY_DN162_c3_g2_i1.p1  ORF type:complete len:179 (+),score=40.12 TRINITY_DN162_c3_g2_i1:29-538(+)
MYFLMELERDLLLHPNAFGKHLHEEVRKALYKEVEGTVDSRVGYIILVPRIEPIGHGVVQEGGFVKFNVKYQAVVFRPFNSEVVDAIVTHLDEMGLRCQVGAMIVFIYKDQIPSELQYDSGSSSWKADDESIAIMLDAKIRLRITGLRFDAQEIFGVGTIKDHYLGMLQ